VAYFINTKLGIEDRTEKSINSMVESNNKMKKLSLTDIINNNFDETINKIMESTEKEVDKNPPEVKKANSPDNLLFDEEEAEEDTVEEVTASGGGAGAGAFLTPGAFKKGGDFDEEMCEEEKGKIHEELQARFEQTPYSQRGQKRTLKRENKNGWTTVELDADGYAPKGMDKNYAIGLHGVDVNSEEESKLSKGSPKGRAAVKENDGTEKMHENMKSNKKSGLNEGSNLSKKKFTSPIENEEKGINKRYIITHKKTKLEESSRWANLSNFDKNSTIKIAESCGGLVDDGVKREVSREQGEEMNNNEFMQRNDDLGHGDEVNGRAIVVIDKPGSLSGAEFKVFEDDYLNESKAFILDFNTGNLVNNPNYINQVVKAEAEPVQLSENRMYKETKVENLNESQAYVFNPLTGQMIRNKHYNSKK